MAISRERRRLLMFFYSNRVEGFAAQTLPNTPAQMRGVDKSEIRIPARHRSRSGPPDIARLQPRRTGEAGGSKSEMVRQAVRQADRQAVRQAHGPEQSRRTHGPEQGRRTHGPEQSGRIHHPELCRRANPNFRNPNESNTDASLRVVSFSTFDHSYFEFVSCFVLRISNFHTQSLKRASVVSSR
jgi:hypothetical protein